MRYMESYGNCLWVWDEAHEYLILRDIENVYLPDLTSEAEDARLVTTS